MEAVYDGERPLGAPDSTRVLFLPFSHADVCRNDVVRSGGIDLIFFQRVPVTLEEKQGPNLPKVLSHDMIF